VRAMTRLTQCTR